MFRLALAREVGTLVVLDDQLVQSDRRRMGWPSTLLREVAHGIQFVVFTCRESDYVEEEYLPKQEGPSRVDHPQHPLRAVDLARQVVRSG